MVTLIAILRLASQGEFCEPFITLGQITFVHCNLSSWQMAEKSQNTTKSDSNCSLVQEHGRKLPMKNSKMECFARRRSLTMIHCDCHNLRQAGVQEGNDTSSSSSNSTVIYTYVNEVKCYPAIQAGFGLNIRL